MPRNTEGPLAVPRGAPFTSRRVTVSVTVTRHTGDPRAVAGHSASAGRCSRSRHGAPAGHCAGRCATSARRGATEPVGGWRRRRQGTAQPEAPVAWRALPEVTPLTGPTSLTAWPNRGSKHSSPVIDAIISLRGVVRCTHVPVCMVHI